MNRLFSLTLDPIPISVKAREIPEYIHEAQKLIEKLNLSNVSFKYGSGITIVVRHNFYGTDADILNKFKSALSAGNDVMF